jgi:hypothetical protein
MRVSQATASIRFHWAERDEKLIGALTTRIRVITPEQAARMCWGNNYRAACARLSALHAAGWLQKIEVLARPEIDLPEPVVKWERGAATPSFSVLAYRLKVRWTEPVQTTTLFMSSGKAAKVFGGLAGGRKNGFGLKRPLQATHDLHVTALYLNLLKNDPVRAEAWLSEDFMLKPRRGDKLPDAILRGPDPTVIEFGGSYRADQVEKLHSYCERKALRYELW